MRQTTSHRTQTQYFTVLEIIMMIIIKKMTKQGRSKFEGVWGKLE